MQKLFLIAILLVFDFSSIAQVTKTVPTEVLNGIVDRAISIKGKMNDDIRLDAEVAFKLENGDLKLTIGRFPYFLKWDEYKFSNDVSLNNLTAFVTTNTEHILTFSGSVISSKKGINHDEPYTSKFVLKIPKENLSKVSDFFLKLDCKKCESDYYAMNVTAQIMGTVKHANSQKEPSITLVHNFPIKVIKNEVSGNVKAVYFGTPTRFSLMSNKKYIISGYDFLSNFILSDGAIYNTQSSAYAQLELEPGTERNVDDGGVLKTFKGTLEFEDARSGFKKYLGVITEFYIKNEAIVYFSITKPNGFPKYYLVFQ
jgi:hypothetical protein